MVSSVCGFNSVSVTAEFIIYRANYIKFYQPNVLFQDNDTNTSNWTTSGGSWGTTSNSIIGSIAITDSPSGAYSNNENKSITLNTSIDLSSSAQALVQFYAKWDLERNYDLVQLEASTNGGSSWTALCGRYNKPAATSLTNFHLNKNTTAFKQHQSTNGDIVYDGDSMDKWVMEEILINNDDNNFLLGQSNVQFRFRFKSDSSNREDDLTTTFDGFIFDDFKILDIQIPCVTDVPTNVATTSITSSEATITWDNIPSATYDLRYKETSSGTWIDVSDLTSSIYNITGLLASSDYEVQVRTKCGTNNSAYTSSTNFSTTAITYCDAAGNATYDTGITQVTLNTLSNSHTNNTQNGGYQDFTAMFTTVTQGSSHTLTVNVDRDGGTGHAFAWIDLNIDGDFEDAGEEFDLGDATTGDNTQTSITPSITFPTGVGYPTGSTRMRIAARYNANPAGPCVSGYDGEVEDYTINIVPANSNGLAHAFSFPVAMFGFPVGYYDLDIYHGDLFKKTIRLNLHTSGLSGRTNVVFSSCNEGRNVEPNLTVPVACDDPAYYCLEDCEVRTVVLENPETRLASTFVRAPTPDDEAKRLAFAREQELSAKLSSPRGVVFYFEEEEQSISDHFDTIFKQEREDAIEEDQPIT